MASIAKKISRAVSKGAAATTRAAVNPLYMVTDKVANKVIPGYGQKVTNVLVNTADPFSATNEGLTKAAVKSLNPLNTVDAIKQAAGAIKSATGTPKTSTTSKVVPDRESYSASASAKESISNIVKQIAEQKSAAADQTPAVQNASTNDNQSTAAANAAAATPTEMRIILDAGNAAREAAMVEQQLPEVVVTSDYKKYLFWGAIAIACVVAYKKLK